MNRIITSPLDTDLYKFTMLQAYRGHMEFSIADFHLRFRSDVTFTQREFDEIRDQINSLKDLKFSPTDISFLWKQELFSDDFLEFLRGFRLNPENCCDLSIDHNKLYLTIRGSILECTMYETYIMAIISEVYFSHHGVPSPLDETTERLKNKLIISADNDLRFTEFGTRRRYSKSVQQHVNWYCSKHGGDRFLGTSNVYFAQMFGLKPIGTMAHEWIMAHQAMTNIHHSENLALKKWLVCYNGKSNIALTDTLTTNHFIDRCFNSRLSNSFAGVRQDSGDPIEWMKKMISHYERVGIDPIEKKYIFSDGLDFNKARDIKKAYPDYNISFGIGTNLTNDVGVKPLNMVIKMLNFDNYPLIKISDSIGKTMCDNGRLKDFVLDQITTE